MSVRSGISIIEYKTAMEVYGAERLDNREGTRYCISVPCFKVGEVEFIHSGSYYIVQKGQKASNEIMNNAMQEFNETYPGKFNYWYGEIHSIRGLLTLSAMIDGKYSKVLVNNLVNETYKKLIENPLFKDRGKLDEGIYPRSMIDLESAIYEFCYLTNPLSKSNIKAPCDYLNSYNVRIFSNGDRLEAVVENKKISVLCVKYTSGHYSYHLDMDLDNDDYLSITYYHCDDEPGPVIYLDVKDCIMGKIDMRICIPRETVWRTYDEKNTVLCTKMHIEIITFFVNKANRELRNFVLEMVK